jgi:integrase
LEKRAAEGLSPVTIETWGYLMRGYIIPHVGNLPLNKLSEVHVDGLYSTLRTSGRRKGEGGVSARTVHHVHRLLSEILKSAVRLKLIPNNPAEFVAPRLTDQPRSAAEKDRIRELLTGGGMQRLLPEAEGTWLHLPILFALFLGLRRGECLGMRWQDVDLKRGEVRVEQALKFIRGRGLVFLPPKTESGRRTVRLPEFIVAELVEHKAAQAAHRLQIGPGWQDSGLVIQQNDTGEPRTPDNLTHAHAKLPDRVGLGVLHFHDLRHGNATLLMVAGVSTKAISARLGHSDTQITRDWYQHVLPEMDDEAASKTDDFFKKAMGG